MGVSCSPQVCDRLHKPFVRRISSGLQTKQHSKELVVQFPRRSHQIRQTHLDSLSPASVTRFRGMFTFEPVELGHGDTGSDLRNRTRRDERP